MWEKLKKRNRLEKERLEKERLEAYALRVQDGLVALQHSFEDPELLDADKPKLLDSIVKEKWGLVVLREKLLAAAYSARKTAEEEALRVKVQSVAADAALALATATVFRLTDALDDARSDARAGARPE